MEVKQVAVLPKRLEIMDIPTVNAGGNAAHAPF